jgi:predicted MFS family arabinose efflux permease
MKKDIQDLWTTPNFRRLWIARVISNVGNGMAPTAFAFAILAMPGGDENAMSVILTAGMIPVVVMLPFGGVLADRLGRARVISIMDIILSLFVYLQAFLFGSGQATVLLVALVQMVCGVLNAFWWPAFTGLPADLVPEDKLQTANSYISLGSNAAFIFGAAAGGWLVATFSGAIAIATDATTFLVAGLLVWKLRNTSLRSESDNRVVEELLHGWNIFWSYKWVVIVVACFSMMVMAMRATDGVLGPVVAKDFYEGAVTWASVVGAQGVGLLIGALVATKWRPRHPIAMGMIVTLPCATFMLSLALTLPIAAVMFFSLVWGAGIELMMVWWITALQTHIPKDAIGRVSAYDAFGSLSFGPIGTALAGPLAVAFGPRAVLYGCTAIIVVMVGLSLLSREVRGLRSDTPVL